MKYKFWTLIIFSFYSFSVLSQTSGRAQLDLDSTYQLEIKSASEILLPPEYDESKKYPLLVFLPPTYLTAKDLFLSYTMGAKYYKSDIKGMFEQMYDDTDERKRKSFIVMLPKGEGTAKENSYLGFQAAIHRYENRILKDIEQYKDEYNIDTDKVVLVGFSLGGDLAWAITNRYPERFAGAIISGCMCDYWEQDGTDRIADTGLKYYFVMGDRELRIRMRTFSDTRSELDRKTIGYVFNMITGTHVAATLENIREALDFIIF